ncbi:MAG: sigma-70 family RNA polymerase sigma factor [Deltaproteobacteria bacterium]|jgi:RNA polymerase sigma factor (TIGR02999 family)|nr:sigma-70 family RNA polymerase sigma factor [Deltaproteobacteria bacterium]MBW2532414.1 sigma-70 family RNA polymerase sigma factor [Deltaproteobacteria bacterium]
MADERRTEIEQLLSRVRKGDDRARDELFDRVHAELRRMAAGLMGRERPNHTLQPTALVHEAFLRIFVGKPLASADRRYFFASMARAMRQLLVEHARKRKAGKRGGGREHESLGRVVDALESTLQVELLDLDEALEELRAQSERQHSVVTLRFFAGMKWTEIAELLDIAVTTAEKDWQAARAWLFGRLREEAP